MKIEIYNINESLVAEIISDDIIIKSAQDALDIMVNCGYQDARKIIWHEKNISPEFFDLKTKLAGEILQKFSNYRVRLAIIGDFAKYTSKSLRDFIFESNKHSLVNFVSSLEEARLRLSSN